MPRKIYRGFATYLAGRGSVVLTYDYRGIGGSRPASLKGFAATMSDWAALDVASAVTWMRGRYKGLPLAVVGHSFGGQAIGLLPNNDMIARSLLVVGAGRPLGADDAAGKLSRLRHGELSSAGRSRACSATRPASSASARTCRRACSCSGPTG